MEIQLKIKIVMVNMISYEGFPFFHLDFLGNRALHFALKLAHRHNKDIIHLLIVRFN